MFALPLGFVDAPEAKPFAGMTRLADVRRPILVPRLDPFARCLKISFCLLEALGRLFLLGCDFLLRSLLRKLAFRTQLAIQLFLRGRAIPHRRLQLVQQFDGFGDSEAAIHTLLGLDPIFSPSG